MTRGVKGSLYYFGLNFSGSEVSQMVLSYICPALSLQDEPLIKTDVCPSNCFSPCVVNSEGFSIYGPGHSPRNCSGTVYFIRGNLGLCTAINTAIIHVVNLNELVWIYLRARLTSNFG